MLHGCWFEDTALGVDQRNSLAIDEKAGAQFFPGDDTTCVHTFDVLYDRQSDARVDRKFFHPAVRSRMEGQTKEALIPNTDALDAKPKFSGWHGGFISRRPDGRPLEIIIMPTVIEIGFQASADLKPTIR
jgi:hypothetical protein